MTLAKIVNPATAEILGTYEIARAEDIAPVKQPSLNGDIYVWLVPSIRPGMERDLSSYPVEWITMICDDCGKETDYHASGLCDSCETQARYDDVSATPAERVLALLDELGVDPSTRRIVEAAVVPLTDEERHEANLISIREEIGYGSALQRVRAGRVPPRAYLIAAYDVSDLTEDEIEALAGEVCAQADRSDGHGSVEMVIDSIRGDASPGYIGHIETPTGEGMIISAVAAPGPDPVPSLAEAALADARRSS